MGAQAGLAQPTGAATPQPVPQVPQVLAPQTLPHDAPQALPVKAEPEPQGQAPPVLQQVSLPAH